MGSDVKIAGSGAIVEGMGALSGSHVSGLDLRATASLVVAGIAANGVSNIQVTKFLDRGYYDLESKLKGIGVFVGRTHRTGEQGRFQPIEWAVSNL